MLKSQNWQPQMWWWCASTGTLIHHWWECKMQLTLEESLTVSYKAKHSLVLTYYPGVTLVLGIYPVEFKACPHMNVYSNCIHNCQKTGGGLPWWRSGWESACQCRGHGFKHWSGKIPHAAEQLGPWATTTEPARLEPVLWNKRGHDKWEARTPRWRVAPTLRN